MEFLVILLAIFLLLHVVFTRKIRRNMNLKKEKVWLGGLMIVNNLTGSHLSTWPLGLLYVKEGNIAVGYTAIFKKEYEFTPSDIVSISPAWVFPFFGRVLHINHKKPLYNEKIYFLSWPFTVKRISEEINTIFYKENTLTNE
jgi:hypothetical protein